MRGRSLIASLARAVAVVSLAIVVVILVGSLFALLIAMAQAFDMMLA